MTTDLYAREQGHGEGRALASDLTPWLREQIGLDVFLTEFPYHQYQGIDKPVSEDAERQMDIRDTDDPRDLGDWTIQDGPFRTDLVGVAVDRRALRTRVERVGHAEPLNQPRQGKRRYRRTYLTFRGDGPMTREYWEHDHGGGGELRTYGEDSARRAFGWLKQRGFIQPTGNGTGEWDAVDLPLHVYGGVHAFELKIDPMEWDTALEQAKRASVYADYRWVVMDYNSVQLALGGNLHQFADAGVGLISVAPRGEDAKVRVHQWAEQRSPVVDRDLLDRYMVERWDCNERALQKLQKVREWHSDAPYSGDMTPVKPDACDILADLAPEPTDSPPLVNTERGEDAEDSMGEGGQHTPLTAFAGDGDD